MRWLSRHQTGVLLAALVLVTWGALFVVYDYRSPVSQFLRGIGTVQVDGWSAYDLDTLCIRLEPAYVVPTSTAEGAIDVAHKALAGGYVRQVTLVSVLDSCHAAKARLAWVVSMTWSSADASAPPGSVPLKRAIVLVDAVTGQLIESHAY